MEKTKTSSRTSELEPTPTFEQSLEELRRIVEELEEGAIGLDESLQRFEKGIALLRTCYDVLEKAEQKIEILTGTQANGKPSTAPFDASATVEDSSQTGAAARKRTPDKGADRSSQRTESENENTEHNAIERKLF